MRKDGRPDYEDRSKRGTKGLSWMGQSAVPEVTGNQQRQQWSAVCRHCRWGGLEHGMVEMRVERQGSRSRKNPSRDGIWPCLSLGTQAELCFPTAWERVKKEGAHPGGRESWGARTLTGCGDTAPGRRGRATQAICWGRHRERFPAGFPGNRCRSCWERGL